MTRYGIWNYWAHEFQFGICEPSKTKARKRLYEKIYKDSYKWRFEPKVLRKDQKKCTTCRRIDCPDNKNAALRREVNG